MDSFRISKAWHLGHEVAESIHYLVKLLPESDSTIPGLLRRLSVTIPHSLTLSVSKKSKVEKLKCYEQARQSAIYLLEKLNSARDQKIIDDDYYQKTAAKVIETQKQLTAVIRKAKQELGRAE